LNSATGAVTYTPAKGYSGPDSFTFQASNAGGPSNVAAVNLTVGSPPAPPTCTGVSAATATNTATQIQLTCSGSGTLTYSTGSAPAHGTLSGLDPVTGLVTYTPAKGYSGPDSFTFQASNAGGPSNVATVNITVG
jgi:hypothetical protein